MPAGPAMKYTYRCRTGAIDRAIAEAQNPALAPRLSRHNAAMMVTTRLGTVIEILPVVHGGLVMVMFGSDVRMRMKGILSSELRLDVKCNCSTSADAPGEDHTYMYSQCDIHVYMFIQLLAGVREHRLRIF